MRVLFLANLFPWPLDNGAVQRVYHLVHALCTQHSVTLVAQRRGGARGIENTPVHNMCESVVTVDNAGVLDRPGGPWGLWRPLHERLWDFVRAPTIASIQRWWDPELVALLAEMQRTAKIDAVWAERAPLAEMARAAGFSTILVDLTDLESESISRTLDQAGAYLSKPLHEAELNTLRSYEAGLSKRFAHVVICKEEDRGTVGFDESVSVVPNGVSVEQAVDPKRTSTNTLLFVGTMSYEPNVDAVKWFTSAALPIIRASRPDTRFSIVGKEATPEVKALHDGLSCVVHGAVPEVRSFYQEAGVVVAPIRLGAGTRLKALEALMFGQALVATSTAVEGLNLRPGIDLEIADTADEIAKACLNLLGDRLRRQRLGENGRKRVLEFYDWQRIAEHANNAVEKAVSRSDTLSVGDRGL